LLKGQNETEPSENFTSVQNSSIQDRPTAESKKVPETLPSRTYILQFWNFTFKKYFMGFFPNVVFRKSTAT
jgi:hypothetical protein